MEKKPKKLHYAWVISIATTLLIFMSLGIISNCFSSYLPFLIKEFNLTNAQNSSLMTARWVTTVVSMLFVNLYYEKVKYRAGMALACLFTAAGHLIYSFATGYIPCVIGSLIMGIGYGLGSMIPATILVSRWFIKNRQLAIGISTAGSSLATMILPTTITKCIERFGLALTFRLEALAIVLIAVIIFLLVRERPEDMGLKPYGYEENATAGPAKIKGNAERQSVTPLLWGLLLIAGFFMGAEANPIYSHVTINYTAAGYPEMKAALFFSITGLVLFVAKIICGKIGDNQGGIRTAYLFGAIQIAGFVFASMAPLHSGVVNALAIFCIGFGTPLPTMSISLWSTDLVNQKEYPKSVARMQIAYSLGSLCFSSVPGIIADHFGGQYSMAFIATCFITLAGLATITIAYIKVGVFKEAIKRKG